MPYHVLLDTAGEVKLGKLSLGTTRRGIGPCYADKALRLGHPRPGPARREDPAGQDPHRAGAQAAGAARTLGAAPQAAQGGRRGRRQAVEQAIEDAPDPRLDLHTMTEEHVSYGHRLEPHIADTARLCWDALDAGKTVIFEGAQATLLDLDHGTYPFVTSSNPIAGAACVGAGVGPTDIDEVWGVAKAYATRVGAGPFPTELDDEVGRHMLEQGHEYGTTTGRERRCGWIDLVALRYAVRLNGMTRAGDHQARRAQRDRPAAGRGPLPLARGRPLRQLPLPPVDPALGRRPSTRSCPASTPTSPAAAARPTCRRRRAPTSTTSPTSSASRSAWSASAPVASRSSGAPSELSRAAVA